MNQKNLQVQYVFMPNKLQKNSLKHSLFIITLISPKLMIQTFYSWSVKKLMMKFSKQMKHFSSMRSPVKSKKQLRLILNFKNLKLKHSNDQSSSRHLWQKAERKFFRLPSTAILEPVLISSSLINFCSGASSLDGLLSTNISPRWSWLFVSSGFKTASQNFRRQRLF